MKIKIALLSSLVVLFSGCGGGSDGSAVTETVIVNESKVLAEGYSISYPLSAGTYTAEITSNNNGVKIQWLGNATCAASTEVKSYSNSCKLAQQGQLNISNPTLLGLGGDEIVTIKVTSSY
jgi:hypothetical protein